VPENPKKRGMNGPAFGHLKIEVKHTVADDQCVAIAYKMTGIHKGTFLDVSPTGHTVIVRGVQLARFYADMRW